MISQKVKIINPNGLHMRQAGLFTKTVTAFESEVYMKKDNTRINAKSILNVLAAEIKCGDEVEIICDGADEKEALKAAVELIQSEIGEQTV